MTHTLSIMRGDGVSIFNTALKDKILMAQRSIVGLADTSEFMTRMVMTAPCDGPEKYWSFGLTEQELIDMHMNGKLTTTAGYEFIPDPGDAAEVHKLFRKETP